MFQFRSGPLHWLLSPAVPFLEAGPAILPGSQVQGLTVLSPSILSLGPVISSLRMPPFLCISLSPRAGFPWIPAVRGWLSSAEALGAGLEGAGGTAAGISLGAAPSLSFFLQASVSSRVTVAPTL